MKAEIQPAMIRWARERAGLTSREASKRFSKLPEWEQGEVAPSLKQMERLAKAFHVPIGYLFLPSPPQEQVPIPDLRTKGPGGLRRPSPDLLDTIYLCQQRQEWFHDFSRIQRLDPLPFIGQASLKSSIQATAAKIREALGMEVEERRQSPTWTEALRRMIAQADELGVLVMVNGVVGNNNRRRLDPDEFRGFAMTDDLAPLVFINGADSKSAQMFTLAHELAHLWLGKSALSDASAEGLPEQVLERWCNQVAAEVLVPLEAFKAVHKRDQPLGKELERLARHFKVSTLVVLRRTYDAGRLSKEGFWKAYEAEVERLQGLPKSSGGDFYLTQGARVGKRFARALIASTCEGQTLYRDAFRMLGFSKIATFQELGRSLGVAV